MMHAETIIEKVRDSVENYEVFKALALDIRFRKADMRLYVWSQNALGIEVLAGELIIMSHQEFYDFLCYNVKIRIDGEDAEFQAKARQYLLTTRERFHLKQLLPL